MSADTFNTILVATDLTEDNQFVVKKAEAMAKQFDAQLHIVHVVEPIGAYGGGWYYLDDLNQELEKEAEEHLKQFGKKFHVAAEYQHLCSGLTKKMILDLADEIKADMVVVGTHGPKGFAGILGSTASSVLNSAKCAVLTIPTLPK